MNKAHVIRLYPTKSQERFFRQSCGITLDRDLNAAKNLASLGSTERLSESKAGGVGSSSVATRKSPTMKQEVINHITKTTHCLTKMNEL